VSSRSGRSLGTDVELTERIHSILRIKGLSLYHASQQSAALYGRSSPYFLPHNLYYDLRRGGFTASVYQVLALSRISGYRLSDWLRVFGIDLENIPRIQVLIPRKRTVLLDTSLTDTQAWIQWFRNRPSDRPTPPVVPLALLLEPAGSRRIGSIPGAHTRGFLYAKIGTEDALACPDLLAGSVVRINPRLMAESLPAENGRISERIFLLEHSKGLFCSHVRRVEENVIVPVGTALAFAQIELQFPSEVRLVGVVDFEIRSLLKGAQPVVPKDLAKRWKPGLLVAAENFGQLLGRARLNANLSFREAAVMSRTISDVLGDRRYQISPSSLCDYEILNAPPRGLHKIITLCCLYGLRFHTLLKAIEIAMEEAGTEPMPDQFMYRLPPAESAKNSPETGETARGGFFEQLTELCEEIPFFLRNALASFADLREVSLDDVFWIGGEQDVLLPYFRSGLLALVNRRRKTPFHFASKPVWKQPVYLLLQRHGKYLCACCGVENGSLVIHPYTEHFHRAVQFSHHKDIEVVGQIVAIARRLT
jgi:hypothetical protein